MRSASRRRRRNGSRRGLIDRLGALPGWAGILAIAGSALVGAIASIVTGKAPGPLLGVVLIAGTFAGTIVVRPRAVYQLIPVPAMAYVAGAIMAGYVHDKSKILDRTGLAAHAGTWVASGFWAMSIATLVAIAVTGVRLFVDYRYDTQRQTGPKRRTDANWDPADQDPAPERDPYWPPQGTAAVHASGGHATQSYPATRSGGHPVTGSGSHPAAGSGGYPVTGSGSHPAAGSGGYPTAGSGGYPATSSGGYPARGSGSYPAQGPGTYPPQGSGSYPAQGPGDHPARGSGTYPGRDSGGYPARDSGQYPAPASGGYPARDSGSYPRHDSRPRLALGPGQSQAPYPDERPDPYPRPSGSYPARDRESDPYPPRQPEPY
jgi:hypothetical protein